MVSALCNAGKSTSLPVCGSEYVLCGSGAEKNLIKAYMWVKLATKGINHWTIAEKTLEKIAKEMSPVEIAEAENLARCWVPQH